MEKVCMNHSSYGAVTLEQKYDGHLCVTRKKSVAHQWRRYIFCSLRIIEYTCSNQLVAQKLFVETLKLKAATFDGKVIAHVVWWEATCLQTTSLWLKWIVFSLHQCAQLCRLNCLPVCSNCNSIYGGISVLDL